MAPYCPPDLALGGCVADGELGARDRGRVARRTSLRAASGRQDAPARRRARSFFTRDAVSHEEALDRAEAEEQAAPREAAADLFNGRIPLRSERGHQASDENRCVRTAGRRRAPSDSDHPVRAHAPSTGSRLLRSPRSVLRLGDVGLLRQPQPELELEDQPRGPLTYPPASDPADSLNQLPDDLGIPLDFNRVGFRSNGLSIINFRSVCDSLFWTNFKQRNPVSESRIS